MEMYVKAIYPRVSVIDEVGRRSTQRGISRSRTEVSHLQSHLQRPFALAHCGRVCPPSARGELTRWLAALNMYS